MAGIRITDLDSALTTPADSDVLVIVDVSENKTKQISVSTLFSAVDALAATSLTVTSKDDNIGYYLAFVNTDNGISAVYADDNLSYNAQTNTLTAGAFYGDGANITGVHADSALNATNVVVSSVVSGVYYPTFVTAAGLTNLKSDVDLTYDAATKTLTSGNFSGAFSGDGSGLINLPIGAGSGSIATTVNVVPSSLNATHYVMFSASSSGVDSVNTDAQLTYNPNTNALSAGTFLGAFSGDGSALTNITVSYADSSGVTNQVKLSSTTSTDVTTYPVLVGISATTAQNMFIDNTTLSYDASTATLTTLNFSGSGALLTDVAAETLNANATISGVHYLMIRASATGDDSARTSAVLSYNAGTGVLSSPSFSGSGLNITDVSADTIDANAATTGVYYPMIRGAATGDDSVHTHSSFTYNVGTTTLSATYFSGDGSSLTNVAASTATTATNANNVAITSTSTNANFYVHFGSASSGNDGVDVDVDLLYNPSTNILYIDADNGKLVLGEDADIEYYHSGTHGYIDVNTGSLYIRDELDSVHSLFDMATGNLHVEGDVIAFSTTIVSDPKFKYNIQPITNSLSKVSELNGVSWRWKNSGLPSAGVISTDVKKVLPEAVKLQTELNSTEQFEAVNYDAIVGLLVEAVKELKKEIEELKSKL